MKLLQVPFSQRLFSSSFSGVRKFHVDKPKDFIGLIGICDDRNSSYLKGTKLAPPKIREFLQCDSSNSFSELKIEIPSYICDYGDYHPGQNFPDISKIIANICDEDRIPLTLGGDHSVTAPVFTAVRKAVGEPITIVHFDAHPDLYPLFQDNVHSHASPFARILEQENACRKLIQVGIRTVNDIQEAQISKYNVKAIEAKDFPAKGTDLLTEFRKHIPNNDSPVYISVDIDVLEPGLAPGISHYEPGGLSVRQLIDALHVIPGKIVGADVVEYNPTRDINDLTAFVASKIVKEIAGKIILSNQHQR